MSVYGHRCLCGRMQPRRPLRTLEISAPLRYDTPRRSKNSDELSSWSCVSLTPGIQHNVSVAVAVAVAVPVAKYVRITFIRKNSVRTR